MSYAEFLARKALRAAKVGRSVAESDLNPTLYPFQRDIVTWACGVGRAAIWADTGLGKTFMQVEWMRHIADTGLIVAPLAICRQTVREAAKLDIDLTYRRDGTIAGPTITNYEMLGNFDPADAGAVVLPRSSSHPPAVESAQMHGPRLGVGEVTRVLMQRSGRWSICCTVPGCDHYVYGLLTEPEARRLASHHDAQHRRNQR